MTLSPRYTVPAALMSAALLASVGSLLGLSVVAGKAAINAGWPPMALLVWAMLGAGAIQVIGLRVTGTPFEFSLRRLRYYVISGVLFALPNALAFLAIPHIGASIVALFFAFPLIFTYALVLLLGLERPSWMRFAGVLAGLAGAVMITAGNALFGEAGGPPASLWLYIALANPVIIALANIYRTRYWPAGATAQELSSGMLITGGLAIAVFLALTGLPFSPAAWTQNSIGLVVAQILIYASLYVLYFLLQDLAGPVYLSQIGSVAAFVGIILAIIFLGEPAAPVLLIAGLPIGLGVYLVSRTNR